MSQEFGLGRGLSSLIPQKKGDTGVQAAQTPRTAHPSSKASGANVQKVVAGNMASPQSKNEGDRVTTVPVSRIVANVYQPRLTFDKDKLSELADSIKEHGILQPLVVTSRKEGGYELIAGERRFRAAQIAGYTDVPVIVRSATDRQKMELALIENIQRHDLNVIEEAKAYQKLAHTYGLSQEEVAHRVGKSRSAVANRLRLLTLPITILKAVSDGRISEGHAKVILSLETKEEQHALFEVIVREHLTVRQTEVRAKKTVNNDTSRADRTQMPLLPAVATAQKTLADALDSRVTIMPKGRGGKVVIEYYAPEDLRAIVEKITLTKH